MGKWVPTSALSVNKSKSANRSLFVQQPSCRHFYQPALSNLKFRQQETITGNLSGNPERLGFFIRCFR